MHRLHYTGAEFLTGSAIAHAVVQYAAELARNQSSAAVEIPIRTAEGRLESVELLIGPASQIVAEPVDAGEVPELEDVVLVEQLGLAARSLTPHPSTTLTADTPSDIDDYPWFADPGRLG